MPGWLPLVSTDSFRLARGAAWFRTHRRGIVVRVAWWASFVLLWVGLWALTGPDPGDPRWRVASFAMGCALCLPAARWTPSAPLRTAACLLGIAHGALAWLVWLVVTAA